MLTAVITTQIFCRKNCPAGPAKAGNFLKLETVRDCLGIGCRPCKRCKPMQFQGEERLNVPDSFLSILNDDRCQNVYEFDFGKAERMKLDRWLKTHFEFTLDCFFRLRRLSRELGTARFAKIKLPTGGSRITKKHKPFRDLLESKNVLLNDDAETIFVNRIVTPLGPMVVCSSNDGICLLEFADRRMLETQLVRTAKRISPNYRIGVNRHIVRLHRELTEYFAGDRKNFGVQLAARGTEFQESVWKELVKVKCGQRISYSELAKRSIGSTSGVRAVGRANGDNGLTILVPCHRIVGLDGSLTGYGGGLWRKQWLLDHEAAMSG